MRFLTAFFLKNYVEKILFSTVRSLNDKTLMIPSILNFTDYLRYDISLIYPSLLYFIRMKKSHLKFQKNIFLGFSIDAMRKLYTITYNLEHKYLIILL